MSEWKEREYDSAEKRTSHRALTREFDMRYGAFKPDRQIAFLSSVQEKDHSFARILKDSGADPQSFVMIDSNESNIEKCQKNWDTSLCLAGMWGDHMEDLHDVGGFNPSFFHYDAKCFLTGKWAEVMYVDVIDAMVKYQDCDFMLAVTVSLKKGYAGGHYDGREGEPNILGSGRMQLIDTLQKRLDPRVAKKWGIGTTGDKEPLAGFYRQHGSLTPMALYVFTAGSPKRRTTAVDSAPVSPKTHEQFEQLHRSVSKVTEFLQTASKLTASKKRPELVPWKGQLEVRDAVMKWLQGDSPRANIKAPCSFGKTFCETDAFMQHIKLLGGKRFALFSPRRHLTVQLATEFNALRKAGINPTIVAIGSINKFVVEKFSGDDGNITVMPTTDVAAIRAIDKKATESSPVFYFCQYQSANKLRKALGRKKPLDLAVCDESHFLSSPKTIEMVTLGSKVYLPAKRWLHMTATPRIDERHPELSMDNDKLFGERIYTGSPMAQWLAGKCVLPQLLPIQPDPEILGTSDDPDDDRSTEALATLHAVLGALREDHGNEYKMVVWAGNAHTDPRAIVDSALLHKHYPDTYFAFMTADDCFYSEPGPRTMRRLRSADRGTVLENVSSYPRSVLIHYDILSVGIDVPAFTDELFLRDLKEMGQPLGRGMRVHEDDRKYLSKPDPAFRGEDYQWDLNKLTKPSVRVWLGVHPDKQEEAEERYESYIRSLTEMDAQFLLGNLLIYRGEAVSQNPWKSSKRTYVDPYLSLDENVLLRLSASVHADVALTKARRAVASAPVVNYSEEELDLIFRKAARKQAKPFKHRIATCKTCTQEFTYTPGKGRARAVCDPCKESKGTGSVGAHETMKKNAYKKSGKCAQCKSQFTWLYIGGKNRKYCDLCRSEQ